MRCIACPRRTRSTYWSIPGTERGRGAPLGVDGTARPPRPTALCARGIRVLPFASWRVGRQRARLRAGEREPGPGQDRAVGSFRPPWETSPAGHFPFLPVRLMLRDRWDNGAALQSYAGRCRSSARSMMRSSRPTTRKRWRVICPKLSSPPSGRPQRLVGRRQGADRTIEGRRQVCALLRNPLMGQSQNSGFRVPRSGLQIPKAHSRSFAPMLMSLRSVRGNRPHSAFVFFEPKDPIRPRVLTTDFADGPQILKAN